MQIRKSLIVLCALVGVIALSKPAGAVLTTDNTNIGQHPNYNSTYSALWRTNYDYSVLMTANDTFLNAPNTQGAILFRHNNGGHITDPYGYPSDAYIDKYGEFYTGAVNASAVSGGFSNGVIAVYGSNNSTSTSNYGAVSGYSSANGGVGVNGVAGNSGYGVYGSANGASPSFGIYGTTASTVGDGVYGTITAANNSGFGVVGINLNGNGGSNNAGVYAEGNRYGLMAVSSATAIYAHTSSSSANAIDIYSDAASNQWGFYTTGNIHVGGATAEKSGSSSWSVISDERTKKNVSAYTPGLAEIEKINPIRFQYNGLGETYDDGKKFVGVVAQEVQKVAPEMVYTRKASLHKDEVQTDLEVVDPNNFTYMLINSVKELSAEVKDLKTQVKQLKAARR